MKPGRKPTPFWDNVTPTGFCWLWTGGTKHGYGYHWDGESGRSFLAHRVAYEQLVEPIPEGMVLDHLCRITLCVNPDHLDVVTWLENIARSPILGRDQTHCKRGHSLSDAYVRSNGYRKCRKCHAQREATRRQHQPTTERN